MSTTETLEKSASEVLIAAVSFARKLRGSELLSSVVSVTGETGITVGSGTVTNASMTIKGAVTPAGKAIIFSVSGGTAGTTYYITSIVVTDGSQTITHSFNLQVNAD